MAGCILILNNLHLPFIQSIVYNQTCTQQSSAVAKQSHYGEFQGLVPTSWSHVITNGYVDVHMLVL